jgi:putative ABC transport system substrate-binding protein
MRRREFLSLLGGTAIAWPLAARAQQPVMPVIGFLHSASPDLFVTIVAAFRQGLNEAGFVEGRNVAIEYRWAEGQYDRLPALAADLVTQQVAVIAVGGGINPILAVKAATTKIPIVFLSATDPVGDGLVATFSRPGGDLTGVYILVDALVAKQFEVLHELVPAAATMALLENPTSTAAKFRLREFQEAARALRLDLRVLNASIAAELTSAFATLVEQPTGALVIASDPFFTSQRDQIVALAARHALPAIASFREYTAAGGLMSYGISLRDAYRLAGTYTGRILKGEKPADLPVEQSTKVEFVINLKTAKTLGLTFPLPLLGRADEVIE